MFGLYTRGLVDRMTEHYEAEIAWLRSEVRYEKGRADRALDQLTSYTIGRPVVTSLPAQPPEDEMAKTLADLAGSDEFNHIGAIE